MGRLPSHAEVYAITSRWLLNEQRGWEMSWCLSLGFAYKASHTRLQTGCQMDGYSKCWEHEFTTRTGNRSPISSLTSPSKLAESWGTRIQNILSTVEWRHWAPRLKLNRFQAYQEVTCHATTLILLRPYPFNQSSIRLTNNLAIKARPEPFSDKTNESGMGATERKRRGKRDATTEGEEMSS